MNKKIAFILTLLVAGLATRLIPHYPNFTALGAVAILGGSMFKKPLESFGIPLVILFVSDIILNNVIYATGQFTVFYAGAIFTYAAVVLSVVLGRFINKLNTNNFLALSILSSVVFFLLSNYGVWFSGVMYPKTTAGLFAAYSAGLPYALSHLVSTVVYGFAILGAYKLIAEVPKKATLSRV